MLPLLTADAMREADRLTIEQFGLPGFTLMETAARGAFQIIEERLGRVESLRVTIFCGKGNNGGDGLALARMLVTAGATVDAVLLYDQGEFSRDAASNFELLDKLNSDRLAVHAYESWEWRPAPDLYVDAILGTGLTSELREPICSLVTRLNKQTQPVLALDVPTGLHSDTGEVLGNAVRAACTVTMGAHKSGLLLGEGPARTGDIDVINIGIPPYIFQKVAGEGCADIPTDEDVAAWLPTRAHDAHKYSAGLALVVGGAEGMTGAPVMASTAAARIGAGAVVCACPQGIQPILAMKMTEVMTLALPAGSDGIDAETAVKAVMPRLEKAQALLVGPGLGKQSNTQDFIRTLLAGADVPAVIDADGLNALSDGWLSQRATEAPPEKGESDHAHWILTPHAGEFKRLAGNDVDLKDRIRTVQAYASRWNCVLLLKGMPTIVAAPDGRTYVIPGGGPALATAGTGDVLAGLCTGLLAQGLSPDRAAVCAAHLGAASAERYIHSRHPNSLQALDLFDELPFVLRRLLP